jgi:CRISPR-associated protein Cmr3
MQIKIITNIDTLIFRDGKPFGQGDDTWTNSLMFPTPNVIYGALRAIYFSQNPDKLNLANTENDPTKDLKITKILFFDENDKSLIFPIPQDIMKLKNQNDELTLSTLKENRNTSNNLPYIFECKEECEKTEGFIIDQSFLKYIKAQEEIKYKELDQYICKEPKIGNKRNDKTKTTDENSLFRIDFQRYKNLSLIIEFEGNNIDNKGLLKLGGEAKGAYYEEFKTDFLPKIEKLSSDMFKLYFLTPAIFKNGILPSWIDKKTLKGEYNGVKLELIAISNTKPQYIGGWDIKENRPKPMFKAVGSGSVYYFKIISGKEKVIETFNYKTISEIEQDKGYGIAIVGDIK